MANLKKYKEQLETTRSIKLLTESLGDIATAKLKRTRASAEQNVLFFRDISRVYKVVRMLAERVPKKSKKLQSLLNGDKNGKTICILLTSNSNFYGGLDQEVAELFINKTKDLQADRIVTGLTGKKLLEARNYTSFEYIQFKKDSANSLELQALSKRVFQYSKVLVYYTKFVTLLNQEPTFVDVSGIQDMTGMKNLPVYYILEPEIDKLLEFFEGQILVLLFQSIFIDVEIAHLAARMIAMNQAENSAESSIKTQLRQIIRVNRQLADRQSINTYSGLYKRGVV